MKKRRKRQSRSFNKGKLLTRIQSGTPKRKYMERKMTIASKIELLQHSLKTPKGRFFLREVMVEPIHSGKSTKSELVLALGMSLMLGMMEDGVSIEDLKPKIKEYSETMMNEDADLDSEVDKMLLELSEML